MQVNETVVYLMVAAIVVGATALAVQAVALYRLAQSAQAMRERVDEFAPRAEAVLASADVTLKDSRKQIKEVTTKANEVLDFTKSQLKRTDDFLVEATARARAQLDRVELVLDDSISRVHETVLFLNQGVLGPVQQVSGVVAGVRTAIDFLFRGSKPDVSRATTDEEMFI
jgi:hypothetical protein